MNTRVSKAAGFVFHYRSMLNNGNGAVLTSSHGNAPTGDFSLQWYRPTDETPPTKDLLTIGLPLDEDENPKQGKEENGCISYFEK